MNHRLLALIFLLIFLWVPLGLYFYFMRAQIASITFQSEAPIPYIVSLEGKLSTKYLPIAESLLKKTESCLSTCQIWPLPPAQYRYTLSASWYASIYGEVSLDTGHEMVVPIEFQKMLEMEDMGFVDIPTDTWIEGLAEFARKSISGKITDIGMDKDRRLVFLREDGARIELGRISSDGVYQSILKLSEVPEKVYFDLSKEYIILEMKNLTTLFSWKESISLPRIDGKLLTFHTSKDGTKILRTQDSLLWVNQENRVTQIARFDDMIDLDDRYRLGYISRENTRALRLSNLTPNKSYFIILDRSNGKSHIVGENIPFTAFLRVSWVPMFLSPDQHLIHVRY